MKTDGRIYIQCDCSSKEHLMVADTLEWKDGTKDFYFSFQLTKWDHWYKRIYYAFKYVLGSEQRYSHWDCVIVPKETAKELANMLSEYAGD